MSQLRIQSMRVRLSIRKRRLKTAYLPLCAGVLGFLGSPFPAAPQEASSSVTGRGLAHAPSRPRLPHPAAIFGGWDTMLYGPGETGDQYPYLKGRSATLCRLTPWPAPTNCATWTTRPSDSCTRGSWSSTRRTATPPTDAGTV